MTTVRYNIRTKVNAKGIRKEKRNGRDVFIVPSSTMPDDIVMNGVMYPTAEIEKSFKTLERTPAPLGHPVVNGRFVSALDPEGLNVGYIGAWNENVRREKGRVHLDKVIDVEVANRTEEGKRLLNAIAKGEPIHTSTGLLANVEDAPEGSAYTQSVRDIVFDHDAILLDEEGAATPAQGVGMFVNGKDIDVVNFSLEESADESLNYAVDHIARALEQRQRAPLLQRIKDVLLEAFSGERDNSRDKENADMADETQFTDLQNRFTTLEGVVAEMTKTITANVTAIVAEVMKPMTETVEQLSNSAKAAETAAKTALVNRVVASGFLSKETAETLTNAALEEVVTKIKPGKAAALSGTFSNAADDEFAGYDFNANLEKGTV